MLSNLLDKILHWILWETSALAVFGNQLILISLADKPSWE